MPGPVCVRKRPDVVQKVKILALSPAIPNDTLSFSPDFPEDLRAQIVDRAGRLCRDRGLERVHRQPGLLRLDRHQPGDRRRV